MTICQRFHLPVTTPRWYKTISTDTTLVKYRYVTGHYSRLLPLFYYNIHPLRIRQSFR